MCPVRQCSAVVLRGLEIESAEVSKPNDTQAHNLSTRSEVIDAS